MYPNHQGERMFAGLDPIRLPTLGGAQPARSTLAVCIAIERG